ncbi:MAG: c-type cytochrome domain-containing protein, partial [Planctomycetota bacterium]
MSIQRVLPFLVLTLFVAALSNVDMERVLAQETQKVFDEHRLQEIRSLLSNRCFACHGPDEEQRAGGFRLDQATSYFAEADSGEIPVKAGDPKTSELLRRIESAEDYERMPPPEFGAALTPEEIELIREWITAGAELSTHWSFKPPTRPALPPLPHAAPEAWKSNPIDRFVLARMLEHGLNPSPRASDTDLA